MTINYEVKDGKRYGVITYNNTTEYKKAMQIIQVIEDNRYLLNINMSDEGMQERLAKARFDVSDKEEYNKIVDIYTNAKNIVEKDGIIPNSFFRIQRDSNSNWNNPYSKLREGLLNEYRKFSNLENRIRILESLKT